MNSSLSVMSPGLDKRRGQSGQSMVEIALLLPLLTLLLTGIIMFGFTFYAFIQVTNAAREGARAGSLQRVTGPTTGLSLPETVRIAVYNPKTGESALGFLPPKMPYFDVKEDVIVPPVKDMDGDGFISGGDQLTVVVIYRYTLPVPLPAMFPVFPETFTVVRSVMAEVQ